MSVVIKHTCRLNISRTIYRSNYLPKLYDNDYREDLPINSSTMHILSSVCAVSKQSAVKDCLKNHFFIRFLFIPISSVCNLADGIDRARRSVALNSRNARTLNSGIYVSCRTAAGPLSVYGFAAPPGTSISHLSRIKLVSREGEGARKSSPAAQIAN